MDDRPEGLESVVAARTSLSDVDGEKGRLIIRGEPVEALCGEVCFEEVVRRLWVELFNELPSDLAPALGDARRRVFDRALPMATLDPSLEPTDAVRALIARLPDGEDLTTALDLLAAAGVFTAAVLRSRAGLAPIAPDPALSHAADVRRMMGCETAPDAAWALDAYLVTVIDHGLNASTFAARVAASTRAGLTSAVLAGLSTLKGPLHGGAPGPVSDMLDEIGEAANARAWLAAALDRGERLMGFGHRVYRVRDPRADALRAVIERFAPKAAAGRLALAQAVEHAALQILRERRPGRALDVNVELYTALLLEALGFPREGFTCAFAIGRSAGWIAHAKEQIATGRVVRPRSVYVGPPCRPA